MIYNVEKLGTINIGRHGENLARVIEIDVSSMLNQWPDATITLLVKRNKDEAPYVAVTELVDGILYWPVTRAETAVPGNGLIEIRATRGETIAKSVTGFIRVSAALTGNETEPPEQAKSWVDQVIEYGNEATQAAIKAKEEADRLSGINAKAVTLPAGSEATVTVEDGYLVYGVPRGPKGDTGDVGPQGPKGEQGIPGADGKDAVVDATLTQSGQAADAKVTGEALALKLTEPSTGLAVGKYFRIAAIDESGHAMLEAVDAPVVGLSTEPSLWPLWTADEQAAARERMGIPGDYELIEEITLSESVDSVLRIYEPDGTAYNLVNAFLSVYVPIQDGDYIPGTIWVYFRNYKNFNAGRLYIFKSVAINKAVYMRAEQRTSNGIWLNAMGEFGAENIASTRMTAYNVKTVNSNITGINIICSLPAGTIIQIYGVRA